MLWVLHIHLYILEISASQNLTGFCEWGQGEGSWNTENGRVGQTYSEWCNRDLVHLLWLEQIWTQSPGCIKQEIQWDLVVIRIAKDG